MSSASPTAAHPRPDLPPAWQARAFGGLALAWYATTTFTPLGVPAFAIVVVFGLLVMLSAEPDARVPARGVALCGRNVVLAFLAVLAFVPVAFGMDLLRGAIPVEAGPAVLATCAAVCVVLPRLLQARELPRPAVLGQRELIISVTALVASVRAYRTGEIVVAMVAFAVLAPVVMAVRRIRLGSGSPGRLARRRYALQAGNYWLFLALLGAAGSTGAFFVWRVYTPGAEPVVVGAFWVGLAAAAVLVGVPRRRVSVAANVLVALGSIFLAGQLVATVAPPRDAVTIGVPLAGEWQVVSGGRSALVNNHWTLTVQRHAIDVAQLVDGRSFDGDRSRLENFRIFGAPVLAVADGRVTAVEGGRPDEPVGGRTWQEMTGNHVILDIGGGRYVLYAHLKQGSLRVQVGDQVRRGQVLGQVGDSGNSDEPHLHLQVQNRPTFDIESRDIRTYPILFDGATISDVRRGDSVGPVSAPLGGAS
jgi:hypothetical protein